MNRNTVETIKQKLSIESVVGSYVKLEKSGKNFRACCPFHNEKTPSFYVTPDMGIFKCFGCHKGGDIFKFVEDIENIPFVEALKMLAEKAGVPLGDYKNEKPSRVSILREIMDNAAKFYEVGLRTHKEAVEYLLSRGVTKETMVAFRIGFAPKEWSNLYNSLRNRSTTLTPNKKYSDEDILATGLCLKGKQAGLYDRFRERIMFPISDGQGRVVAFTGRVLPGTEEASRPVGKYINSPETELYHKSSILFGYDKAKSAIHAQGFAIIVEGQMDLIMSHQAGITNVVALSGTASTDEHMVQLARFTNDIVICLDADRAGLAAAQKTAMVAYKHGMQVAVVDIPNGKDPADIIRENPEAWKDAIAKRKDFITFRLEKMLQEGEAAQKTTQKVLIATKELFPILAYIEHQITIDEKLQQIAKAFHVSAESVRADFQKFKEGNPIEKIEMAPARSQITLHIDPKINLNERILGILLALKSSDHWSKLKERYESVLGSLEERLKEIPVDIQSQYILQTELMLGPLPEMLAVYEHTFHDLLVRYELMSLDEEKQKLDLELAEGSQNEAILQRINELSKRKHVLIHQLSTGAFT